MRSGAVDPHQPHRLAHALPSTTRVQTLPLFVFVLPASKRASGSVAVAKFRTVDRDHAVVFGCQINQVAGLKIFDHAPVAVQQEQRSSSPAVT